MKEIDEKKIDIPVTQEREPEDKPRFQWRVVDNHSPPEIYNFRLYVCIFIFGILGSLRGLDEGNSAATNLPSFKKLFGLDDPDKDEHELANLVSNIKSMVQLGSILGAILSTFVVDKLGRLLSLQIVCFNMIITTIIQMTSKSTGQLYAGRFLEGAISVGLTVAIGPAYLSEVTPKAVRGMANCIFAGAVYLGIMLSYFAVYGSILHVSDTNNFQWMAPLILKILVPGILLILSLFYGIESPRWYIKVGKNDKAVNALAKLRNLTPTHPFVIGEISDITESVETELAAKKYNNFLGLFRELLFVKSLRYRFFLLGCLVQLLGQWSGANAITIYASELFGYSGIKGNDQLKMTAVLGVVKFTSAYFGAFFVIDFLGRRKALYIGVFMQMISILYFGIFLTLVPGAEVEGSVLSPSEGRAAKGAIGAIYVSGMGWTIGFNSLQYLIGSEIFPLNIRTFAQSWIMILHFANQYGNSKALPKMLLTLEPYGTFYFFVAVNAISLLWAFFFIPEVSGRSLESMEDIFNLPWYLIGRKGHKLCPDHSEVNRIDYATGKLHYLEKPEAEYVEDNRNRRDSEEKEDARD